MVLFHNIGISPNKENPQISENYNTIEEVLSCKEDISFDGVYRNVYLNFLRHKDQIRDFLKNHKIYLFVIGKYIGRDNSFDSIMPLERFCTLEELMWLKSLGCLLGWHTMSHPDLTSLDHNKQLSELKAPKQFSDYLAYPYGRFNSHILQLVNVLNYKEAWTVHQGNDSKFQRKRHYYEK